MVAVEARGDLVFQRSAAQQVAGELFDCEAIERQVAVVGLDHPIAPAPHVANTVVLVAAGVGIAGGVQPAGSHPLAVARRSQQTVDHPLVGVGRSVGHERRDFGWRGWQARQVQRHAAQSAPCLSASGEGARPAASSRASTKASIGLRMLAAVLDRGNRGSLGRNESPVLLPHGSLVEPSGRSDRPRRARVSCPSRAAACARSGSVLVIRRTRSLAADSPGHDRPHAVQLALGAALHIQPQLGLPRRRIRTVALEAVVGQQRPDVAIELHRRGSRRQPRSAAQRCHGDRQDTADINPDRGSPGHAASAVAGEAFRRRRGSAAHYRRPALAQQARSVLASTSCSSGSRAKACRFCGRPMPSALASPWHWLPTAGGRRR